MIVNRIVSNPARLIILNTRLYAFEAAMNSYFHSMRVGLNNSKAPRPRISTYLNSNKIINSKAQNITRFYCESSTEEIDAVTYENVCDQTLDSLCEFFEDVIETSPLLKTADVSFGDGVLTVNLDKFGTYVINRQSPNKQIWLSSPTSGPKRYDFVRSRNGWFYRHDNQTLHSLLQKEISAITNTSIDLSSCAYSGYNN